MNRRTNSKKVSCQIYRPCATKKYQLYLKNFCKSPLPHNASFCCPIMPQPAANETAFKFFNVTKISCITVCIATCSVASIVSAPIVSNSLVLWRCSALRQTPDSAIFPTQFISNVAFHSSVAKQLNNSKNLLSWIFSATLRLTKWWKWSITQASAGVDRNILNSF